MLRRHFLQQITAGLAVSAAAQNTNWDGRQPLRFVLEDPLDHPFFQWPRTLLSYPLTLPEGVAPDTLVLTRLDTGATVPVQFSNVSPGAATLHFFSDLPSGARREFTLTPGAAAPAAKPEVRETREGNTIILDTGPMLIRIPATQTVNAVTAPGAILQVARNGRPWIGESTLQLTDGPIRRITANRTASGPLFIRYEITWESAGGSRYIARIQADGGSEFIRFYEDMEALGPGVKGVVESTWTGFDVTHRQAPNHPVPVVPEIVPYEQYAWERIDDPWRGRDIIMGSSRPVYFETPPEGELPFCLGIFQSWPAHHVLNDANFWSEKTGDALGVFVDETTAWQDHEYAYEVESTALQVRFHHRPGQPLRWRWPLWKGTRSTAIACYPHDLDKQAMQDFARFAAGVEHKGITYRVGRAFTSHTRILHNYHGILNLNRVKNWILRYPAAARQPAPQLTAGMIHNPAELERLMMASGYLSTLPVFGARENGGSGPVAGQNVLNFSPVPSRRLQGNWLGGFNSSLPAMTPAQRDRLTAAFLFLAYIHMGDDYMPVVPMLAGHPNFLADVKAGVGLAPFLFPEHPMAATWADHWQKCLELNTRFNTRPSVEAWDARGGRWTENLGTYVWAFLHPTLRAAFLLRQYDGVERCLSPQIADLALWLVNSLSAPFEGENPESFRILKQYDGGREWGVHGPGQGLRRVHPPQGAHAERRLPAAGLWHLGNGLRNYAPLAAEYAMWASRPTDQESETRPEELKTWSGMYDVPENTGTNPHLRSAKYTGYGVVLRAAVDTPDEVSVHLQQIDDSPNYRWGRAGEGNCGTLYFFAAGKAYSHNGPEDTGDRIAQDTDFATNFGVYKDGKYQSIGMNVLARPMYDLGLGQFAEVVPRTGPGAYSSPEYVSRSVLLAGPEYFILHDQVLDSTIRHRFSWYVRRGEELPSIKRLRGGNGPRTTLQTDLTHGLWIDGTGESVAVVSHRKDIEAEATPFGASIRIGNAARDLVFLSAAPLRFAENGLEFHGNTGFIRTNGPETEFAVFHGSRIAAAGLEFETTDPDLGIGGAAGPNQPPQGIFQALQPSRVRIRAPFKHLYLNGVEHPLNQLLDLSAGRHHWELTDTLPTPLPPAILRTENHSGGARVIVQPSAGATDYQLELSRDAGRTWTAIPGLDIANLESGRKVQVRATARNADRHSAPGPEYPLYVSNEAPSAPDGLRVELAQGAATITWGEVLGAAEYRLYARPRGAAAFTLLYRGLDRRFTHRRPEIRACDAIPGTATKHPGIIEYTVTAFNGNGESRQSRLADTDPASWRNWDPRPGEPFRRLYSSEPIYPPAAVQSPRYYPK